MKTFSILFISLFFAFLSCSCTKEEIKENNDISQQIKSEQPKQMQKIADMERPEVKTYKIEIVNKFPHNTNSFTQGLLWHKGFLYEGTGLHGQSGIQKDELKTGKILKAKYNSADIFGEGITLYKNKIYQITWQNEKCFVYDFNSFEKIDEFSYSGEGWGITNYEDNLIMSNGSNILNVVSPDDFKLIKSIYVTDNSKPVMNLNELEYIKGEIWANIWTKDIVAIIDPKTAKVRAYIDLSLLNTYINHNERRDVLNGIAYDKENDKIYVTGKLWDYIFEIKLTEK
jgi:glutamine cyclotransferase